MTRREFNRLLLFAGPIILLSRTARAAMQIFVRSQSGRQISLVMEPNDTVLTLKKKIQSVMGTPLKQQQLTFNGKVMQDDHVLVFYKIMNLSIVHLVTIGGGKVGAAYSPSVDDGALKHVDGNAAPGNEPGSATGSTQPVR